MCARPTVVWPRIIQRLFDCDANPRTFESVCESWLIHRCNREKRFEGGKLLNQRNHTQTCHCLEERRDLMQEESVEHPLQLADITLWHQSWQILGTNCCITDNQRRWLPKSLVILGGHTSPMRQFVCTMEDILSRGPVLALRRHESCWWRPKTNAMPRETSETNFQQFLTK